MLDADVIGLQEIFSCPPCATCWPQHALPRRHLAGFEPPPDPVTGAPRLTPEVALISRLPLAAPARPTSCSPTAWPCPTAAAMPTALRAPLHAQVVLPDQRWPT
jgi:hypothetical protein